MRYCCKYYIMKMRSPVKFGALQLVIHRGKEHSTHTNRILETRKFHLNYQNGNLIKSRPLNEALSARGFVSPSPPISICAYAFTCITLHIVTLNTHIPWQLFVTLLFSLVAGTLKSRVHGGYESEKSPRNVNIYTICLQWVGT